MIIPFPTEDNFTFLLPGPVGQLEVITTKPAGAVKGVAIICHPDPRQGGTMNNKVVTTAARAFAAQDIATVRFNFRGIGKSSGSYGEVKGELEDLLCIRDWIVTALPDTPLWLAGFSFGSYISALAAQNEILKGLISIAPPVSHYDFYALNINCPWLVIQGDQDEVVPFDQVQSWAKQRSTEICFVVMKQVTHFFHGRLPELRDHIEKWINLVS
ncbi:MAG: alpha/beta fold hydrolase [Proteobacteria bacterium]|nr:alpha/beta fold hydrolase [Pseudomonadota bacterium]